MVMRGPQGRWKMRPKDKHASIEELLKKVKYMTKQYSAMNNGMKMTSKA